MIIALAGRRIDAPNAPVPRFPTAQIPRVREQLQMLFTAQKASAVVASGACGADLLALDVAGKAHIPRMLILPFRRALFRELSVVDRPGEWGPLFDAIYQDINRAKMVKTLGTLHDMNRDFARANMCILDAACRLQKAAAAAHPTDPPHVLAVLVWDGKSRGEDDMTAAFGNEAQRRGILVQEVLTIPAER